MAKFAVRLYFQVTDINGDVADVSVPTFVPDTNTIANLQATAATLAGDISSLTNGKITKQSFSVLLDEAQYVVGSAPPNNAEYSSVTDGAKLSFGNAAGERTSLTIPAPIEAMFGANSNVVDTTSALVGALITSMETIPVSPSSTAYNLYKGGVKTGRGSRRRATRLIP
jgi:hypothetical protein